MNLNYQEAKNRPIDNISAGYKERGKSNSNNAPASDSVEAIRKRYETDPSSLSPIALLTLGLHDLKKDEKKSEGQQGKTDGGDQKKKDEEMVSAKEFEELAANIANMQKMFSEMNGSKNE